MSKIIDNKYHKAFIFFVIFLFLFSILNPVIILSKKIDDESIRSGKKWTIMIYEDMDFYHCLPGIGRIDYATQCRIKSNDNVNVLVLQDTVFGPGKIWYMRKNIGRELVKKLDEVNMGDYSTLKNYIDLCKKEYPAERYMIDFYDHGYGWLGCCWDETGKIDFLSMQEIYDAINDSDGIDIVSFLTPCNMAAIESIYELKDVCDVFVGREVGACMTKHVLGPLSDFLDKNPDISTVDVGDKIIDIFIDGSNHPLVSIDMKSFRTDKMDYLIESINNLCIFLIDNMDFYYQYIKNAYTKSQRIPIEDRAEPSWVKKDLYDFSCNLQKTCPFNKTLYDLIDDLKNSVNETVINQYAREDYPNLHAMHIYYPEFYLNGIAEPGFGYLDFNLDFIEDCLWDEFLSAYNSREIFVDSKGFGDYTKIQDAVNNSTNNSIIYVKNGIYCEDVVVDKPVYIIGESLNDTCIIGTGNNHVFEINSDNVTLHMLKISNSGEDKAAVKINADHVDICSCKIVENEIGISVNSSDNSWVYYSTIKYNKRGIILHNCSNSKISHNLIDNNEEDCVFYDSYNSFWENTYDEEKKGYIRLKPKIIPGFKTILNVEIPCFNLDFIHTNHMNMIMNRINGFLIDPIREILDK